jgi:hypothetical protein
MKFIIGLIFAISILFTSNVNAQIMADEGVNAPGFEQNGFKLCYDYPVCNYYYGTSFLEGNTRLKFIGNVELYTDDGNGGIGPTVTSVNGNGTAYAIGVNNRFHVDITYATTATKSITITFGNPWTYKPSCIAGYEGDNIYQPRAVSTETQVVIDKRTAFATGSRISVLCF